MKDISLFEIHTELKSLFVSALVDDELGRSNACKMYDKMVSGPNCDNCLGENFNQMISDIETEWFDNYHPSDNLGYYFTHYCLSLYLFVERVEFIFHVINKDGKSKLFNDFRSRNFATLIKIAKWANFIKHPKQFLFTHWPIYQFEGTNTAQENGTIVIDTDFIFKHYTSEKNEHPTILENSNRVVVKVPDLVLLTKDFCRELNLFFDFVCNNEIIADFLSQKSTIVSYFEETDQAADNH